MQKILLRKSLSKKIAITLSILIFSLAFLCASNVKAAGSNSSQERAFLIKKKANRTTASARFKVKPTWNKKLSSRTPWGKIKSKGVSFQPTIFNDSIYVGTAKKVFYAFDLSSGALRWKFKTASAIDAAAGVYKNMVCFGTTAGVLHCLDKVTGKELWSFNARSEIISAPLLTERYVYFTSGEDKIYTLERDSGKRVWTYTGITPHYVMPRIITSPVLSKSQEKLFVLLANGSLLALDTRSGKELWSVKIIASKLNVVERARRRLVATRGELLMIDNRGMVVVHSQKDGKRLGTYPVIKTIDFIVIEDSIYLLGDEMLVKVNRENSEVIWSTPFDYGSPSLLARSGEHLVVISNKIEIPYDIKYLKRVRGHASSYTLGSGNESFNREFRQPLSSLEASGSKAMALVTSKGVLRVFNVE
jgi:outer membrane protein assembly factor BamB